MSKQHGRGTDSALRIRIQELRNRISSLITKIDKLTVVKAPTSFASTGVTNIPVGATEVSIFNNGTGDAEVNGTKIPAGVTRTFGFNNPTSAIIVCDGGGTEELIIDYMV